MLVMCLSTQSDWGVTAPTVMCMARFHTATNLNTPRLPERHGDWGRVNKRPFNQWACPCQAKQHDTANCAQHEVLFIDQLSFDLLCQPKQPEHTDHCLWRDYLKQLLTRSAKQLNCLQQSTHKETWTNEHYCSVTWTKSVERRSARTYITKHYCR